MNGFRVVSLEKWAKVGAGTRKVRGRWLWTNEDRADLSGLPAGEQRFWGVPFRIPSSGRGQTAKLIVLAGEGLPGLPAKVTVPVGAKARWVVVAHFSDVSWPPGSPMSGSVKAGEHLAVYRLVFADGSVEQPVRRRFEISDFGHGWGQFPFNCRPHVHWSTASPTGSWGNQQTDVSGGGARLNYWLFPWRNPRPDETITAIEFEATSATPVAIAAVTLCEAEGNPLTWTALEEVTVKFARDAAPAPEDLRAELDRGVVARVKPLPGRPRDFVKEPLRGWGERRSRRDKVSAARIEAYGSPGATLTVKTGKGDASVNWGEALKARGTESTDGTVRVKPAYRGKAHVHVEVVDAQSGKPTPVRVRFLGPEGEYLAPVGHHTDVNQAWFEDIGADVVIGSTAYAYVDGSFQIRLPVGPVAVEVVKGFEYTPVRKEFTVRAGQRKLTLKIGRWSDLREQGFYSGDTHIHFISTESCHLEAQAEGINVANILAAQWGRLFTNVTDFTGKPSGVSTDETIVYVNTENRQHMLGHLILLGQKKPVFPLSSSGPSEAYLGGDTEVSLADWCDASHQQGGLVIAPHFPNPYCELAADIILGKIDAAEIRPWTQGEPNFVLREYYRYLNLGCRLPCVGGTDKMSNSVPVGIIRTYAQVDPEKGFSYDTWCDAIRAGRTFTTTGPLIRMAVDGKQPGDDIRMRRGGGTVEVQAAATCALPLTNLRLVQNGRTVAQTGSAKGRRKLSLTATVKVESSCWLAVHAWGPSPSWPLSAHSSPVYVIVDNQDVFVPGEASYALTLMEGGITWARNLATFRREAKQRELIELFREARRELEERLEEHGSHGHAHAHPHAH